MTEEEKENYKATLAQTVAQKAYEISTIKAVFGWDIIRKIFNMLF